jgi:hypothetical protein
MWEGNFPLPLPASSREENIMANATITSIAKHIKYKGPVARKAPHANGLETKITASSCCRPDHQHSVSNRCCSDHYRNSGRRDSHFEAKYSRQNRMALAVRDKDQTMQQIGRHLNQMRDALSTMVEHSPPYPPGSEHRIEVLKNVGTLRKQIEQLTFPSSGAQNTALAEIEENNKAFAGITANDALNQWLPELTENADDSQITSSIVLLNIADEFIHHQRNQLKSEANALFPGEDTTTDKSSVEFTSLFIGKHFSHHPDTDLTTAQGILKEYLN